MLHSVLMALNTFVKRFRYLEFKTAFYEKDKGYYYH
jgi:hypothetical protein